MDSSPVLKPILQWALDNGVPTGSTGSTADPHYAIRFACERDCFVGVKLLVDCYNRRNLHLDLNVLADALVRKNEGYGRRCSEQGAAEQLMEWLQNEMGFRFTIEHMRVAVIGRELPEILKLHALGCPWDATLIPSLILNSDIEREESQDDGVCDWLKETTQQLLWRGCPIDITACHAADANPHAGWARDVLNGMECPCGHSLHRG